MKQVGQSRRFENSKGLIGHIKLCSINCLGKKIGIISSNAQKSGSSILNSFHIYDTETDSFIAHDLGE